MSDFPTFEDYLNESDAVETRIDKLANDPEVQKKMGASAAKLKDAFMALFKRGYGAAETNWAAVNPNIKKLGKEAAKSAWGYARVNAFIEKTKGYETADADIAAWLKGEGPKPKPMGESVNEARGFTISELRTKAYSILKSIGVLSPSEKQMSDTIDKIKELILSNKLGKVIESEVNEEEKPRVGHTVKRKQYKDDPPDIGLYSKGGRDAIKGTGYSDKEKAEFTIKKLDELMSKGERVWAMSIATTMESRAKKHQHQTDGMRDAIKVFRAWIDKNKKSK